MSNREIHFEHWNVETLGQFCLKKNGLFHRCPPCRCFPLGMKISNIHASENLFYSHDSSRSVCRISNILSVVNVTDL